MTSAIIDITSYANNPIELDVLAEGTEAELKIIAMRNGTDKNGNQYISPMFEVLGYGENVRDFSRYIGLPGEGRTAKENVSAMSQVSKFAKAFGIDISKPFSEDEVVGKRGWAILGIEKDQDGDAINKVNKFVTGA